MTAVWIKTISKAKVLYSEKASRSAKLSRKSPFSAAKSKLCFCPILKFCLKSFHISVANKPTMIDESVYRNITRNESFFAAPGQRCFFLDPLNEYKPGGLLYIESVVTSSINFIGAFFAFSGNGIICLTFWKSSQLRSQSQLFLWCLAFADFLTGMIVQPFYGAYKIV